jgi:cobalt-precorrin-5B (C1)-methyltransferase
VARAAGLDHVAGATGRTSEAAVAALYGLPPIALIDMGDFVGGMLKYLRRHPVARITIAGGMAKMSKLGQGLLDLHSRRGEVDLNWLARQAQQAAAPAALVDCITASHSALEAFGHAEAVGFDLAGRVVTAAWRTAAQPLAGTDGELEIVIFDRWGRLMARSGFSRVH